MDAVKVTIHIQSEANPTNVVQMISALLKETTFSVQHELVEFLTERNISNRGELPATATDLGILERQSEGLQLSAVGRAI